MSPTRKVGSLFESGAKLIDELSAEESMREFPKYLYLTSITISLQLNAGLKGWELFLNQGECFQ